jgi:hypothetical protein
LGDHPATIQLGRADLARHLAAAWYFFTYVEELPGHFACGSSALFALDFAISIVNKRREGDIPKPKRGRAVNGPRSPHEKGGR